MKGKNASDSIRNILEVYGPVEIDESSGRLTINTNVPWIDIQQKIEESGRKAVLSGFGGMFHCQFYYKSVNTQLVLN